MITLVYTVLARAASSSGQEARALDLLSRLHSFGQDRNQRRFSIVSLAEQIRIHAARRRAESCSMLQEELDAFFVQRQGAVEGPAGDWLQLVRDIAVARVQIATRDLDAARKTLRSARTLARKLHRTREWLEARVLLAFISDASDPETVASLRESLSIAEANGFLRLFADAHPDLLNVVRDYAQRQAPDDVGASPEFLARLWPGSAPPPTRAPTKLPEKVAALALLTAKEASILLLLAQGYSNKEIARATDIGQETVKWHLKNLFGKLHAGSRRHAVDRARTLGLLQA
jgi:LuxR family transcriptional regulator, maltose regulon positive regulatory protein